MIRYRLKRSVEMRKKRISPLNTDTTERNTQRPGEHRHRRGEHQTKRGEIVARGWLEPTGHNYRRVSVTQGNMARMPQKMMYTSDLLLRKPG